MALGDGSSGQEGSESGFFQLLERLSAARWLIVASAAMLVALTLAGLMTVVAAIVVFAGFVALTAVVRRAGPSALPTARTPPAQATWPDTSIKLFAEALPDPRGEIEMLGKALRNSVELYDRRFGAGCFIHFHRHNQTASATSG